MKHSGPFEAEVIEMGEQSEARDELEEYLDKHPEVLRELDTDLIQLCRDLGVL